MARFSESEPAMVPAKYAGIVASAIRGVLEDIAKDMADPEARPRHVPAFGVEDDRAGMIVVAMLPAPTAAGTATAHVA